jgi:hypothetical protein
VAPELRPAIICIKNRGCDVHIDIQWWTTNWPFILIALLLVREFLNNLLNNCPFLQANRSFELVQGVFNALAATVTKSSSFKEQSKKETIITPDGKTTLEETINAKIPADPPAAP